MLRYSVDPWPRQASMSAVYALFGVVLIPVSFLAIRLAEGLIHPVVFDRDVGSNLREPALTFVVCLAGMLSLAARSTQRAHREAARRQALRASGGAS